MNMPGGGINAVAKIGLRCPATKTLMLTVVDDEEEVRTALKKGARGYLLKGTSSQTTPLTAWTESGAIHTGDQVNHLTIRAVGDLLTAAASHPLSMVVEAHRE